MASYPSQTTNGPSGGDSSPFLYETTQAPSRPPDRSHEQLTVGTLPLSDSPAAPVVRRLGSYELLSKLGEGGMGAVYRARHIKLDRIVAIKLLSHHSRHDSEAIARFEREMKAIGKLDHPHIVRALDAGEIDGTPYLAMEFVEGQDLKRIVEEQGPLPIVTAVKAISQTAGALASAHRIGLIHRDIKPANLLLTRDGNIKLLDLGLALLRDDAAALTQLTMPGEAFGTPDYMAPEQWGDAHGVDARTDLYALGCTLFSLLTGRAPYSGESFRTVVGKMAGHTRAAVPDPRTLHPEVPEQLAGICRKLMAKDPEARFQTADELVQALKTVPEGDLSCPEADSSLPSLTRTLNTTGCPTDSPHSAATTLQLSVKAILKSRSRLMLLFGGVAVAVLIVTTAGQFRALFEDKVLATAGKMSEEHPQSASINVDHAGSMPAVEAMAGSLPERSQPPVAPAPASSANLQDQVHRLSGHSGAITCLCFSPDEKRLYSGSLGGELRVWDVETQREIMTVLAHPGERAGEIPRTADIAISRDGQVLASTGGNSEVILWNTATMERTTSWSAPGRPPFYCLDMAIHERLGRLIVTSSQPDASVRLWQAGSGEPIREFPGHSARVGQVKFNANAEYLVTADLDFLRVFSVESGGEIARFPGRRYVTFTPKSRIIGASLDTTIKLWEIGRSDAVRTFEGHEATGESKVHAVAVSTEGTLLLSCGTDRTARVWDYSTGVQQYLIRNEINCTSFGAISSKGRWIAYAGGRDRSNPSGPESIDFDIRLCELPPR